jgi:hypothetical protein
MFQCHVNVPPVCSKSRLSETEQYTPTLQPTRVPTLLGQKRQKDPNWPE